MNFPCEFRQKDTKITSQVLKYHWFLTTSATDTKQQTLQQTLVVLVQPLRIMKPLRVKVIAQRCNSTPLWLNIVCVFLIKEITFSQNFESVKRQYYKKRFLLANLLYFNILLSCFYRNLCS